MYDNDEETDQYYQSHQQISETEGERVLAHFEDEFEEGKQHHHQPRSYRRYRVCCGGIAFLLAFVSIAVGVPVGVLLREGSPSNAQSDIELLAKVVLPGVNIFDLNWTTSPQYRALEWLVYNDTRSLTIKDNNSTELLERFSLVTLYYALMGEDWQQSSYCFSSSTEGSEWLNVSSSHCNWCSIECNENDRVHSLLFFAFQLHGTLPPEIGNFQGLKKIEFGINSLRGSIPTEIGNLRQLTSLALSVNNFSGTIPSEIGNLQQLTKLDLSENIFSGTIPSEIGNLRQQLTEIYLFENNFLGTIPSEIGNLKQLTDLHLFANNFSGTIPSDIGNLQQLTYLELWNNAFSGTIPSEIGNLRQLTDLELYDNHFTGVIPSEIGNLQQLKYLHLNNNIGLSGTVPVEVGQLESITSASFQNTSLTGGLDDLAFCQNREATKFFQLTADCGGSSNPKITCECCTKCW
eukprot:scaffold6322_cov59-Cylindrotheca_fusiformis.AAC.27